MIEKLPQYHQEMLQMHDGGYEVHPATALDMALGVLSAKLNEVIDAVNRIEDGSRCPSRCSTWNVRCDLNVPHEGLHRHGNTEDGMIYWGDK